MNDAGPKGEDDRDAADPASGTEARETPAFDRRMLETLVCPVTRNSLDWDAERFELISRSAGYAFPVREGIPIMLIDEARRLDD